MARFSNRSRIAPMRFRRSFHDITLRKRAVAFSNWRPGRLRSDRRLVNPDRQILAASSPSASKSSTIEVMTSGSYSPG